jgi:hypothetical protein
LENEKPRDLKSIRSYYDDCMPISPTSELPRGRLSADIEQVLEAFGHRAVTLGEIVALMQQRAYVFLLLIVALPFSTPVPLPGLSTPFGLIIAFIGFRIACGLKPWLPKRMLSVSLPAKWLPKLFRVADRLVRWLERFLRPSFTFLVAPSLLYRLHGAVICVCGALLLLPIPVPMTNFFPAVAIVLLACAMLESDGRFSIAGGIVFLIAVGYFTLLGFGGTALAGQVSEWWHRIFGPIVDVRAASPR